MYSQKGVHDRIHTLRGEQFRHLQNLRGSRSHLSSNDIHNIHAIPPLPLRLLSLADLAHHESESHLIQLKSNTGEPMSDGVSCRSPAGPLPPKSWKLNSRKDTWETATWRDEALSLVLSHRVDLPLVAPFTSDSTLPFTPRNPKLETFMLRIPSLSLLCFQILLDTCTISEFQDGIVPYIPTHLRKNLIRFSAVHSPLSIAHLYALWGSEGHVDGEVIVVGPSVTLREDYFIRSHSENGSNAVIAGEDPHVDWEWDMEEADMESPLYSLVFLNTSISSSTLFSFPPTLTHLALINISMPVPLHRLPHIAPLIIILDVSYNAWLGANSVPGGRERLKGPQPPRDTPIMDLRHVDWPRWNHLKVLGFRGNYVPENFLKGVNKGRWDEITVVL